MPEWVFAVGPARAGTIDTELTTARSRTMTFRLSSAGSSEAQCEIDGLAAEAARIQELATDLHVFRRPAAGFGRIRLFRGRIANTSDKLDSTSKDRPHAVTVPALDYRALLMRRLLMTGSQQTWAAGTDLSDVAWGLLTQAQNKSGGDMGITRGVGQSTGVQSGAQSYKLGDEISAKIQELSEAPVGFDWDVTPSTDPASGAMTLDVWSPQRGAPNGVILDWGGAVTAFDRTIDSSTYANAVRMNGTAPDGGTTEPAIQERYAPDLATAAQGRWDKAFGEQITTDAALSSRADWQIGSAQVLQPSYTLTLKPGWWRGPTHVWLGDPVRWIAYSGPRIRIDTTLRVREIPITITDEGDEQVQLVIGAARPDYRKRAAQTEQRITTLERR